ncbi:MAG: DUF6147 family protein [Lachnospiraceae bacterium]|nr:DUF6147 family protein [Lachnospiraceae bacterium]
MGKMQKIRKITVLMLLFCMVFGAVHANAADELLGTVVDGSLLTDETEVETTVYPLARWSYLASGNGTLTVTGTRSFRMTGSTMASKTVDRVHVQMYLQRLKNGTWVNYKTGTLGTAYDTYYVVSTDSSLSVESGYYYRALGAHKVVMGSTVETASSYTDGIWVD